MTNSRPEDLARERFWKGDDPNSQWMKADAVPGSLDQTVFIRDIKLSKFDLSGLIKYIIDYI